LETSETRETGRVVDRRRGRRADAEHCREFRIGLVANRRIRLTRRLHRLVEHAVVEAITEAADVAEVAGVTAVAVDCATTERLDRAAEVLVRTGDALAVVRARRAGIRAAVTRTAVALIGRRRRALAAARGAWTNRRCAGRWTRCAVVGTARAPETAADA